MVVHVLSLTIDHSASAQSFGKVLLATCLNIVSSYNFFVNEQMMVSTKKNYASLNESHLPLHTDDE